ncbi:MAG: hypothetical protein ACKVP0_10605 [Pirellulaceae bacterium]
MSELRPQITCVNCWASFPPEEVLWIAEHPDLTGDSVAGDMERLRFLPSRFDLQGNALDLYGVACRDLACPKCHLTIPRSLLEREPVFISVLGTPSCGKSYYLGALAATLRRELPGKFGVGFTDADSTANVPLIAYEEHLFHHLQPNEQVPLSDLIPKTQLHGAFYQTVSIGGQPVSLPKPMSFLLQPLETHARFQDASASKLVCLYDNAGEHYLPGGDSVASPGTRHMAESNFLLFLYDPTQDPRWHEMMRKDCPGSEIPITRQPRRQEDVLREAFTRVRKLRGLADGAKHDRPLLIILNKCDLWKSLVPKLPSGVLFRNQQMVGVNLDMIFEHSTVLRNLLIRTIPELVYAAEGFCHQVYFLAASALGVKPTYGADGQAYICPRDIHPQGVILPFVLGLQLTTQGLLGSLPDNLPSGNGRSKSPPPHTPVRG